MEPQFNLSEPSVTVTVKWVRYSIPEGDSFPISNFSNQ